MEREITEEEYNRNGNSRNGKQWTTGSTKANNLRYWTHGEKPSYWWWSEQHFDNFYNNRRD